jgi:hypothetical protein
MVSAEIWNTEWQRMSEITIDDALASFGVVEERSRTMAEFWFSLPKTNRLPSRRTIQPEEIPKLLPYILIHELISPTLIRIRLAGTAMDILHGRSTTGMNYLGLVSEDRKESASRSMHLACDHLAGKLVQIRSTTIAGRIQTREVIAFPVRGEGTAPNLLFTCTSDTRERPMPDRDRDDLHRMDVLERTYFDIGAGVPDFTG